MVPVDTFFLSPDRIASEQLIDTEEYFKTKMALDKAIKSIDGFVMILNSDRQLVWANDALADYLNCNGIDGIGLRPGELLDCQHAFKMEGGCGTSWACQFCGAALAMKSVLEGEMETIDECSLIQSKTNKAFQFRVKVHSISYNDETYLLCVFFDISAEKRREELEQAFVHDIANLAGNVDCLSKLLHTNETEDDRELFTLLKKSTDSLVSAVDDHRSLILAEKGDFDLARSICNPVAIIVDLVNQYREHASQVDTELRFSSSLSSLYRIEVIPSLLRRSVENLLKNAIEASIGKELIEVNISSDKKNCLIEIVNTSHMSEEVRGRIFTRSFSTKGEGRGIGLYSVKLFVENYLNGTVIFDYNELDDLVTFAISLPAMDKSDIDE